METAEDFIDPDSHKSSSRHISASSNCVNSPQSPDLLENCQGDDVFTETVVPRPGPCGNRCYKFVKENLLLSIATIMLVVCMIGNWILMDVLTRSFLKDVKQGLILQEKTTSDWTHPNVHSYISVHSFTLSEGDDQILIVSEVGPYVYRVNVEKVNVTWHSNSTVSYRERYTFFYDQAKSVAEEASHVHKKAFVILFQQNNSLGPMLNVYTGKSDFSKLYQTYSYNYTTNMSFCSSEDGNNKITGTDGSMFQPWVTEHDQLTLFYPQLLRTFELRYSNPTTFKDLPVYRYTIPDSAFVNSSCFCRTPGNNTGASLGAGGANCTPPGVYGVSTHKNGAVKYISLPHFLGADPYYHHFVKGLDPQETKHRPIFDVDKVTGKTVRQKRRFQVNMHRANEQGHEVYMPMYWAELSQEVDDNDLETLRKASDYLRTINVTCLCVGISLGLLLTAVLSILIYKAVKRRSLPNQYRQLHPRPGLQCCKQLKWF